MRKDVSHIKLEQTVQQLYKQNICGGHPGFSVFVHFSCKIFVWLSTNVVFVSI